MLTSKSSSIEERLSSPLGQAAPLLRACKKNEPKTVEISSVGSSELCFIRLKEVLSICGKSRSSIYASIKDGKFPAPIKVGGRSSAWLKSEVLQWAQRCIASSRVE
jgi:predicted DNA-binding transcriptional regulator AlpA